MSSIYPLAPFGSLVEINPKAGLDRAEATSFVEMSDIGPERRFVSASQKTTKTGGARFRANDTLFARISPCLQNGKIAQYASESDKTALGSTEFLVFRARACADPAFVYYLSKSSYVREPAERSMIGASGRQRARTEAISAALVPCPGLPLQIVISSKLSAYDDLIEVNLRRITILERIAESIFAKWFDRHDYPEEDGRASDEAPQEWDIVPVEQLINFDPKTKVEKEGLKRFVPMSSLSTVSSVITPWQSRTGNAGSKFQNGDTLMARITPCLENGKTGLVNFLDPSETAFGSTEFAVMRGTRVPSAFVYLLARSAAFRATAIKSMGGADGRQRVRLEALKAFQIALPPTPVLQRFAMIVDPLFEQVRNLADQNYRLRTVRDLLLPRLLSGEIDVSTAKETFAEAAE